MNKARRNVEDFQKKYKYKVLNKTVICKTIENQGYTIIPFSKYRNDEKTDFLIHSLGIEDYVNSCYCFTYQDDRYRLVFLNSELSEDEAVIVLAHEEGHIWNKHVTNVTTFGSDVIEEYEANEFAHYLLLDKNGRKKRIFVLCLVLSIFIAACVVMLSLTKKVNDQKIYMDNYYRTASGTKYHIEGCIYLKNKIGIRKLTKEEFESGEYDPCAVCIQFESNDN